MLSFEEFLGSKLYHFFLECLGGYDRLIGKMLAIWYSAYPDSSVEDAINGVAYAIDKVLYEVYLTQLKIEAN